MVAEQEALQLLSLHMPEHTHRWVGSKGSVARTWKFPSFFHACPPLGTHSSPLSIHHSLATLESEFYLMRGEEQTMHREEKSRGAGLRLYYHNYGFIEHSWRNMQTLSVALGKGD